MHIKGAVPITTYKFSFNMFQIKRLFSTIYSKYLRDVAIQQLLDIYSKKYPEGDRQTIIKKLANFRSAYYRELKKVKNSVSKWTILIHSIHLSCIVSNSQCPDVQN